MNTARFVILVVLLAVMLWCFLGAACADSSKTLRFSGYSWQIIESEETEYLNDTNLRFDRQNVWVDEQGRLHLKISNSDNGWYSAGLICTTDLGYGQYIFFLENRVDMYTDCRLDQLDEYAIFNISVDDGLSLDDVDNINIAFSPQVGISEDNNHNSWFRTSIDNQQESYVYYIDLDTWENLMGRDLFARPTRPGQYWIRSSFNWEPTSVRFESVIEWHTGPGMVTYPLAIWELDGASIKDSGKDRINILLTINEEYLNRYIDPLAEDGTTEVIISRFKFIPAE